MATSSAHYVRQNTEVGFVKHAPEFIQFYCDHENLNVEISGIKEIKYTENGVEKVMIITKSNFWFGIKRLTSFITNYLHYLTEEEARRMLNILDDLETDFSENKEYSHLAKKENLTNEELVKFNLMYFEYLIKCFDVCNKFVYLLQSTLMISTKMRKKEIIYREDSPFFDNLGKYRKGISNSLSNFKMVNLLEHFKYILGYYYTYSNLIDEEYVSYFDEVIYHMKDWILSKATTDVIVKLAKGTSLSSDNEMQVKLIAKDFKRSFQLLYYYINVLLREKNIFPNAIKKNLVDTVRNI